MRIRQAADSNVGDMYFMGRSATKFFKHWPELSAEYHDISLHNSWLETYKHDGEIMIKPVKAAQRLRGAGLDPNDPPGTFQMRPLVYQMFINQLEKLRVTIQFGCRVVEYFENETTGKGGAKTEDGKVYEADIVIAADGVGSKSQQLVGGQVRAQKSGRAMWRAAFPRHHLDRNPEVKKFFSLMNDEDPIIRTWLG